jgi:hypothetical protein
LGDGASVLVREIPIPPSAGSPTDDESEGLVRAGRRISHVRDGVIEASATVRETLAPVLRMSQAVLEQLRESGPDGIEVEFGIELSAEAGAVLASTSASCHLQITLSWNSPEPRHDGIRTA